MQYPNFRCPQTGEEFYIPRYKTIPKGNGVFLYKDPQGKQLINPTNNVVLESIPLPEERQGIPLVQPSIAEQKVRNGKMFKERAKKHGATDEQQHLKKQRFNEEFKIPK